jgi:hypothetical protein
MICMVRQCASGASTLASPAGATRDRRANHDWIHGPGVAGVAVITQQLQQNGASLETLMGGHLDGAKTIGSLTLFETAGLSSARMLLDRINRRCSLTQARLDRL